MRRIMGWGVPLVAAALLCGCGTTAGGINSPGAVAAVADATLPPPNEVVPVEVQAIVGTAVDRAFDAIDVAATAADAILVIRPSFAGSPAALQLASALEGAKTWLNIARAAQKAGQASNYAAAMEQASAALTGARGALLQLRGK